jgi:hypothetical protein
MIVVESDDTGTIAEMIVVIEVGTTAAIMVVSVATGPTTVVIMLQKKHL